MTLSKRGKTKRGRRSERVMMRKLTRARDRERMSRPKCRESGKIVYETEEAARLALMETMAKPGMRRTECGYYVCDHCGKHHLTSIPQRRAS